MPRRNPVKIEAFYEVHCEVHGLVISDLEKRREAEQVKQTHLADFHEGESYLIPDFNDVWGGAGPDRVLAPTVSGGCVMRGGLIFLGLKVGRIWKLSILKGIEHYFCLHCVLGSTRRDLLRRMPKVAR